MRRFLLAVLLLLPLGCAPSEDPASYGPAHDAWSEVKAFFTVLRYIFTGLSREPSDADLHAAVVDFFGKMGTPVTSTTKIACYKWEGDYTGNGNPVVCRYSLVLNNEEKNRTSYENGFDHANADHWYMTLSFGDGLKCIACESERLRISR